MFLNNLYDILELVANSHSMVNTVRTGTTLEVGTEEELEYVYVFYEVPSIIEFQTASEIYTIGMYVLERTVEDDLANRIDMISKTKAIGQQILYYLDINYENDFTIIKEGETSFNAVSIVDDFADRIVGWRFEFKVQIATEMPYCNITIQ